MNNRQPPSLSTTTCKATRKPVNQRVLQEVALRYFVEVVRAGSVTEAAPKASAHTIEERR